MKLISQSKKKLLEYLAEYKYLTTAQIVTLGGVRDDARNLSYVFKGLVENKQNTVKAPLIKKSIFGVHPKRGRLRDVYYLTKQGAKFCQNKLSLTEDQIKYPKNTTSIFEKDYFHRIATIDFEIAFKQWTSSQGYGIDFFERYFDVSGSVKQKTLRVNTAIEEHGKVYLEADTACIFKTRTRPFLFLGEITFGNDSGRALKQNLRHAYGITKALQRKQYSFEKGCFITCVFEQINCMQAVMRRMADAKDFKKFFLFKTIEEVKTNFGDGWRLYDGQRVNFYS